MGAKTINEIITSPFFASKIIYSFICGYNKKMDYSILYLILPVIYNGECRKKLNNAKNSSSIYSLFSTPKEYFDGQVTMNSKTDLYNLFDNQQKLIPLLNKVVIILNSSDKISILSTGEIINNSNEETYKNCKEPMIRTYLKSAYYLGLILSKSSIHEFIELMKGA